MWFQSDTMVSPHGLGPLFSFTYELYSIAIKRETKPRQKPDVKAVRVHYNNYSEIRTHPTKVHPLLTVLHSNTYCRWLWSRAFKVRRSRCRRRTNLSFAYLRGHGQTEFRRHIEGTPCLQCSRINKLAISGGAAGSPTVGLTHRAAQTDRSVSTGGSQRKIAANVATLGLASLRDGKADSRQGEYDRGQGPSVHRALQFDVSTIE